MNFRLPRDKKYDQLLEQSNQQSNLEYGYDNYFKLYSVKIPCPAGNKLDENAIEGLNQEIISLIDFLIKESASYTNI